MNQTPRSNRLHIGIFGRRNVGKSSLLNAIARQRVSIVSPQPGTTTDAVEKPMELLPIGPVVFIDTAGIDDRGALGMQRVECTRKAMERTDVALVVAGEAGWTAYEQSLADELTALKVPVIAVLNKADLATPADEELQRLRRHYAGAVATEAASGKGVAELRQALIAAVPDAFVSDPPLVRDLVPPGEMAVLVTPIDLEAPKDRLILPQVQTIRDLLDGDAGCVVVKEHQLDAALRGLTRPPALVVTDSQAFEAVAAVVPGDVPLTSFSILFARHRGDLNEFVRGAMVIDQLNPGDRVLIAEACSHHPIGDDIGRVKIPRWLTRHVGGELAIDHCQGRDFPGDLPQYRLVVHCGSCMFNRRQVLHRVLRCRDAGVPITNYGMTIAYTLGLFDRALQPFPEAHALYRSLRAPAAHK